MTTPQESTVKQGLFTGMFETALAVRDINKAGALLSAAFQSELDPVVSDNAGPIQITQTGIWTGQHRLAIMSDSTGKGPVQRFLDRRGEGLYEICIRTTNIREAMAHMRSVGVKFVLDEPIVRRDYPWRDETWSKLQINWTHPASTFGLLVELQEWER